MGNTVLIVVFLCLAVIGIIIVYWAEKISLRYNAWTTSFRERHPHINPPPTPAMRTLNTKIMTWLFRLVGVYIVLYSFFLLLTKWKSI
jgi:hypothetical protein